MALEPWPLRLQAEGEGLEQDTQILVTDKAGGSSGRFFTASTWISVVPPTAAWQEMDINRKFKKAFCEPGNSDFCPPATWVEALLANFEGDFLVRMPRLM